MKTFYKISGILFVFGCIFFLKYNFQELKTYKTGYIVEAKVVFVPVCLTTRGHYNIKFIVNGNIYAKEIGTILCKELKIGQTIRLKTNSENSVFLYENENPYKNMFSSILLFLFGIFLIYMGFKK
jgi:hypothetical protein